MIVARAEDLELSAMLGRQEAVVAVATAEVSAAALHADWLVVTSEASMVVGSPAIAGGLAWRMGASARKFLLTGPRRVSGPEAVEWGIADALVPEGSDAMTWTAQWAESRSALAFDVAAVLVRSRGGDALERALFAWLFSTGEPQEGLRAFLEKRPARFARWAGDASLAASKE